ncbi:hypothetical protein VTP01DRAFT_10748 [Rhizomucor pusillus]|uniref:uncharacterized protein n=1 Tax=Rhizomucor pusillus TaxID=4840 RepID=UPI003741E9FE
MEGKSTDDWLDRWHMLHCVRIERSIKQNHFKISRAIASGARAPFCNCPAKIGYWSGPSHENEPPHSNWTAKRTWSTCPGNGLTTNSSQVKKPDSQVAKKAVKDGSFRAKKRIYKHVD